MADYAAVLRKTIDALAENTPEARAKIYERARGTIEAKLAAVSSPPELAARQRELLENAIAEVEAEYGTPAGSDTSDDATGASHTSGVPAQEPFAAAEDSLENDEPSETEKQAEAHQDEESVESRDEWPPAGESSTDLDENSGAEPHEPVFGEESQPVHGPEATMAYGPVHGPEEADEGLAFPAGGPPPRRGTRRAKALVPLLLGLVVLGGAAYGGWHYRDDLTRLAGLSNSVEAVPQQDGDAPAPEGEGEAAQAAEASVEPPVEEGEAQPESAGKFTQRLLEDGQEVDEGPAGGQSTLGEGTSVAAATQTGAAQEDVQGGEEAVPVGQSAIFYEERTNVSEGSAQRGTVVWSMGEESPGDNLPPEPVIHAEARIPGQDIQLKMTIRRNIDQSLPASHIIELIFLTPEGFGGGGIDNILRVAMKRTEQDTGSPLLGMPAKIADGFFLVALSDSRADLEANTTLMRRQSWIDIPIVYTSGRRALITLEKGVPGERIFSDAVEAWSNASSG